MTTTPGNGPGPSGRAKYASMSSPLCPAIVTVSACMGRSMRPTLRRHEVVGTGTDAEHDIRPVDLHESHAAGLGDRLPALGHVLGRTRRNTNLCRRTRGHG